jgi:hypothetical protein
MNDQEPPGISQDEISLLTTDDKRWKRVEDQFNAMNLRLSNQDMAIEKTASTVRQVAEDTAFMRQALADGMATVRFFCRLAAAWRFLLKQVFLPIGVPLLLLYVVALAAGHKEVPA